MKYKKHVYQKGGGLGDLYTWSSQDNSYTPPEHIEGITLENPVYVDPYQHGDVQLGDDLNPGTPIDFNGKKGLSNNKGSMSWASALSTAGTVMDFGRQFYDKQLGNQYMDYDSSLTGIINNNKALRDAQTSISSNPCLCIT